MVNCNLIVNKHIVNSTYGVSLYSRGSGTFRIQIMKAWGTINKDVPIQVAAFSFYGLSVYGTIILFNCSYGRAALIVEDNELKLILYENTVNTGTWLYIDETFFG